MATNYVTSCKSTKKKKLHKITFNTIYTKKKNEITVLRQKTTTTAGTKKNNK